MAEGRISAEDGEDTKIILSKATELLNNSEFSSKGEKVSQASVKPIVKSERLFIKLKDLSDQSLVNIYRISSLNPGKCQIVLFDESTGKYVNLKGGLINPTEKVLERLRGIYGERCVVLK